MKSLILFIHIVGASASLPLVITALIKQLVTKRAVLLLRRISLITFGAGVSTGAILAFTAPSIPKACVVLGSYVIIFALFFGFLWGEDPDDCPYLQEQDKKPGVL